MATAYRSQMFAEVFGDGSEYGLEISYAFEEHPLGTGGGIRNAAASLRSAPEDPVVVLNGDVLSGHDLAAQIDMHRKADAAVTLHLVDVPDPARFGCVPTDLDGRVTAFLEKTPNPVSSQINAGCYVFTRRYIDAMPAGRVLSVERETFPDLIAAGETVMGYVESAYWLDVGTPEAFVRGSRDLVLGELASPALPGPCGEALLLPGAVADPSAKLSGGTVVGAGSVIGAGAAIDGSVIFDGVSVGAGSSVSASVLGAGARIGAGAVLDGVVIGAGAEIGGGNELRFGLRVWPGVRLDGTAIRFSTDA
jgi:mannose-1-phosphate guanylyltransferase